VPLNGIHGKLVHLKNDSFGCHSMISLPVYSVLLVQRGECSFSEKVRRGQNLGALAVIVGNNQRNQKLMKMHSSESVSDIMIPSVFISKEDFETLKSALDFSQVSIGVWIASNHREIPFLLVLVLGFFSPVLIMFIFYAFWIVHWIVQMKWIGYYKRHKCAWVLLRIPVGVKLSPSERCTICLEDVEPGEKIRLLNCTHEFHKNCMDEWLSYKLECPNCKEQLS